MDYQERLKGIERKMNDALKRQDAETYAGYCDELGLSEDGIADRALYEQGRALISHRTDSQSLGANSGMNIRNYGKFVRDARREGINAEDFAAFTSAKRRLLAEHFRQFSQRGQQDISNYGPEEVGKVFKRVLDYARNHRN